jgi:RsiW-degrading membrane proteinase PrsW (M82 family)
VLATFLNALVGLLPVVCFLAALVWLDSYKLVSLRTVLMVMACGVAAAVVAYFANAFLLGALSIGLSAYSRYAGPIVEEILKGAVIVALIRTRRVGFLVDAAILGFAVGTGFAIIENLHYQRAVPDASLGTWIVRGFGTAIMHGGATAIFAMMSLAMLERSARTTPAVFAPGIALASLVHSAYNHVFVSPLISTLAVLVTLPPLMIFVFWRSERVLSEWLGRGLDADADMLHAINSGRFPDSPAGKYLTSLRERFKGPIVGDLLCYLRLHTELAMRAKGLLLARENGFDPKLDTATREKLVELAYLERSIGRTGLLALQPMLHGSHKDLWQLSVLGE